MSVSWVSAVILFYFFVIFLIAHYTIRGATTAAFFNADRESPWYLVAFGMIGTSLSGVTFISIPGWVAASKFGYMQIVLGYLLGYAVIALMLMPLYYKLKLISIYSYLEIRFGFWSYKTGASFFLISRVIGAACRLFLVAGVLQLFLFQRLHIPFGVTVFVTLALIWLYTFRGGIKTIVWTDTLQTFFMLISVIITIILVAGDLSLSFGKMIETVQNSTYSQVFFWDFKRPDYFWKQFFSGALIAIVMTGLDQDMMQKNLTCRNIREAQKNMFWFSIILVFVNLLFLTLGALLYTYAEKYAIPVTGDDLYPLIAKDYLGIFGGTVFLLGIIAAAYSSADSALTALTTSFCVDFLDFDKIKTGEARKRMKRIQMHLMFSFILLIVILVFKALNNRSVIDALFQVASYTYGPLLGLFAFGILTKWKLRDKWVPVVCILSPMLAYLLNLCSEVWFNGFEFGYLLLLINGLITFIGLSLLKVKTPSYHEHFQSGYF